MSPPRKASPTIKVGAKKTGPKNRHPGGGQAKTAVVAVRAKSGGATKLSPASRAKPSPKRADAKAVAARPVRSGAGRAETLLPGRAWARRLTRGQILRITDVTGRGCVSALFYNAREPGERYNMADTLKAQYTAFLTAGRVLYSDMGRVMVSVIADTCGWHDTISGCGDAATGNAQYGPGRYQELRNDFHRNARDNFLVELSKRGLGKRDIVANVNFFVRVSADAAGRISWFPGNSQAGAYVELRAEMDTLVVLSNTPHPLDPSPVYDPPPIELSLREASPAEQPGARDRCRLSRPENERGFALTEAYLRELQGEGASVSRGGAW